MNETTDGYFNTFSLRFWTGNLDLRPLGFMRIAFGAVLLWSMADLAPVLYAFFSDQGVAPRWSLLEKMVRANRFCIFDIAGPLWVLTLLYVLTLVAILFFIVGWHSRLATVATYFLVCGIHERNLLVFDGSDNVLRVLLFWMLWMPSGARYSVDAVIRSARGLPLITHASALPMRMGQLNIAWIYLNTIIYKWPGVEWHNGTALRIALGLDHLFTRTLGHLMFNQRWFVWLGTHGTVLVELCFLPLFFLPLTRPKSGEASKWPAWLFQPTYRALAIAGGTSMHLGIATLMSVGNFSYIMISAYFLLYEPTWIDWIVRHLDSDYLWKAGRTRVLYDGACARCAMFARILAGFDVYQRLQLIDLRSTDALTLVDSSPVPAESLPGSVPAHQVASPPEGGASPPEGGTPLADRLHAITPEGKRVSDWEAFLLIARRTPALLPLAFLGSLPGLHGLGGALFLGLWKHPGGLPVETPPEAKPVLPRTLLSAGRTLTAIALPILMFYTLWFSLPEVAKLPAIVINGTHYTTDIDVSPSKMPNWIFQFIQESELWQKWDMFSPKPLDHDVYIEGRGELADGTQVDVLRGYRGTGGPLVPPVTPSFFFTRWTKYINNILYEGDNSPWTLELGRYICRQWNNNATGRSQLKTFKLFREEHRVELFDEKDPDGWHEVTIWDHHCF